MIDFNIEIKNLNLLHNYLYVKLPKLIDKEQTKILNRIGKIVVEKSRAFAPYKTGLLERSIVFQLGRTIGGQSITVTVPMGSRAAQYAGYMHERYYKPGPLSRMKSGAGRKFIERAIVQNKAMAARIQEQALIDLGKKETPNVFSIPNNVVYNQVG